MSVGESESSTTSALGGLENLALPQVGLSALPLRSPRRDGDLRRRVLAADIAALLATCLVVDRLTDAFKPRPIFSAGLAVALVVASLAVQGLYTRRLKPIGTTITDQVPPLAQGLIMGCLLIWLALSLVNGGRSWQPSQMIVFAGLALLATVMARVVIERALSVSQRRERVLLAGNTEQVGLLATKLGSHPEYGLEPIGALVEGAAAAQTQGTSLDVLGGLDGIDIQQLCQAHQVDRVILTEVNGHGSTFAGWMSCLRQIGVNVSLLPPLFEALGSNASLGRIEGLTLLSADAPRFNRAAICAKRLIDVVAALVLLACLLPALAVIVACIRLDSPGPALFWQRRVGQGGRKFWMVKFRTMKVGAEAFAAELQVDSEDANWLKLESDPRLTTLGRLLRVTSVDELPELWNVLKGEMSLVGPRPLIEEEAAKLAGWVQMRFEVPAGMTGLWQVLGRTQISFEDMLRLDYLYVTSWSLAADARILLHTLPCVLSRRGAN